MNNNIIIEVKNLKYKYRSIRRIDDKNEASIEYKEALQDVNFTVTKGEKISVIGPNGAGKSTLLLNLAGLMEQKSRSGEVLISGKTLDDKNLYNLRENIGFVFQNPNDQLFSATVFDDVAFGLINSLNKKKDPRAKDREFIESVVKKSLASVNLFEIDNNMPHFLSFGEKKLVALATVLSYSPEILLLDEPSGNLDPKNRGDFIKLIKGLEKTMIIATHDLDLAYEFSDRTIILNKGKIMFDGDTKKILRDKDFLEANKLSLPLMFKNLI
ncbi:MAG TPA: ABC transporter ATP-binding protein [Candidatus Humimicrobiaceae bacterium]